MRSRRRRRAGPCRWRRRSPAPAARRERAGGDDRRPRLRQPVDALADDLDVGMRRQRRGDALGEALAVHRQRRSGGHLVHVALREDQRSQVAHLLVEQAHRVALGIVAAEAVRADQLGEPVGVVRGRRAARSAHLGKAHPAARLRELPRGLRSREPAPMMWMSCVTASADSAARRARLWPLACASSLPTSCSSPRWSPAPSISPTGRAFRASGA